MVIFANFSCSINTLASYLPQSYGTVLTLEVAVIRYYLAIKAAKCAYPSNLKVLLVSASLVCCYAASIFGYVADKSAFLKTKFRWFFSLKTVLSTCNISALR